MPRNDRGAKREDHLSAIGDQWPLRQEHDTVGKVTTSYILHFITWSQVKKINIEMFCRFWRHWLEWQNLAELSLLPVVNWGQNWFENSFNPHWHLWSALGTTEPMYFLFQAFLQQEYAVLRDREAAEGEGEVENWISLLKHIISHTFNFHLLFRYFLRLLLHWMSWPKSLARVDLSYDLISKLQHFLRATNCDA